MLKQFVFNLFLCFLAIATLLGCSKSTISGPVQVMLIRPTGEHCKYSVTATPLETVTDLNQMRGQIGRVMTTRKEINAESTMLETGSGFDPIDVQFTKSGDVYGPVDAASLMAASLYYSIETGYSLFKGLDTRADLATLNPNLSDTVILQDVRRVDESSSDPISDNAEYLPYSFQSGNTTLLRNYFFSYPTKTVEDMPLGLNLGIMVHEFTHMVFQYLFYQPGIARNVSVANQSGKPTESTLSALDEGLADYFGFMAVKDPGYFQCSFPTENRDLRLPKEFNDSIVSALETGGNGFDPHEGGAVFAAIQYQIGETLGNHETNAKALVAMMATLVDCSDVNQGNNTIVMNFASIAKCHERQFSDSRANATVHQVYQKYLGNKYRGQ